MDRLEHRKVDRLEHRKVDRLERRKVSTFKFQLRNGEDLGYSTDCQPGFFVQTGGVVPPILYLESFCS